MMRSPRNLECERTEAHVPSFRPCLGYLPKQPQAQFLGLYRLLPKSTLPRVDLLVCTALSRVAKGSFRGETWCGFSGWVSTCRHMKPLTLQDGVGNDRGPPFVLFSGLLQIPVAIILLSKHELLTRSEEHLIPVL